MSIRPQRRPISAPREAAANEAVATLSTAPVATPSSDSVAAGQSEAVVLPSALIRTATHDFADSHKIGQGGFGGVFKADGPPNVLPLLAPVRLAFKSAPFALAFAWRPMMTRAYSALPVRFTRAPWRSSGSRPRVAKANISC